MNGWCCTGSCPWTRRLDQRDTVMEATQPKLEETDSGIHVKGLYDPSDVGFYDDGVGEPGQSPFTRGNYAHGYRRKLWTFRQYSGFGSPEESNARYRYLLDQ